MNKDTRLSGVLHAVLHMAQVDHPLTSEDLAQTMGTNSAVVRRTLAGLRDAGYIRSGKGHGGGWQLARPISQISLLDIYEALDKPTLFAIGNRNWHPLCKVEQNVNAALSDTFLQAEKLLLKRLGEVTLDQLLPHESLQGLNACGQDA